ncbi:MAG: ComF family protein [Nodosilinea sp.]
MQTYSSSHTWLNQGKRQLLGLFLASPCPLCQRSTTGILCSSCDRLVRQCQTSTPCDRTVSLRVVSWGRYEGSLRQVIGRLKYSGHAEIAQFLGTELGQSWRAQIKPGSPTRPLIVVPIPLHPTKLQQRGFNQADLLAEWFCRSTRLPLCRDGLLRIQATQPQHSLDRSARQQNLSQAFAVNPGQTSALRQAGVWLLDDIFTTGATAQSAAQTLRQSGIAVAGICAVARAAAWDTSSRSRDRVS